MKTLKYKFIQHHNSNYLFTIIDVWNVNGCEIK